MEVRIIAIACVFAAFTAVGTVMTFLSLMVSSQLLIDGFLIALLGAIGILVSSSYLKSLKMKKDDDLLVEKIRELQQSFSEINRD
ncbi:MAG: hypothetical protein PWQ56_187 [Patescibacteria group bacterium]|nr:hypothetical protein [Patescibacteria group bacterium]